MSRITAYRSYAAECLARAGRAAEPADRQLFIEMAAGWHELATMLADYMEKHPGEEPPADHPEWPFDDARTPSGRPD
jgi:hypothetical protein